MSEHCNQGIANRIKLKILFNKCQTLLLAIVVITCAVSTVWFAATYIADQRESEDIALTRALRIRDDVEMLASLHVAANTDFLKGIGTSQWASHAWPVARVGAAARTYDDLERAFMSYPASLSAIQKLRLTTSRWEWELEIATATAIRRGNSIAIDSSRLLSANETLREISAALATLRATQNAYVGNHARKSARRQSSERALLTLSAFAALVFLSYGFVANHRLALARARARIVIEKAETRFNEYFEQHPLAMMIYDVSTLRILAANDAAAIQYGYSRDALRKMQISSIRPTEDVSSFLNDLTTFQAHVAHSGSAGVRRHVCKDGTTLFVEVSYHFLEYAEHKSCFIVATNVTDRERANDALQESKQMLNTLIDSVPHRIFWKDKNSRYLGCNRAFARDIGIKDLTEVVGRTDDTLPWRDHATEIFAGDVAVVRSNEPMLGLEYHHPIHEGRLRWLRVNKVPLCDARGEVIGLLGSYEDITDYKDAELALRLRSRALDAIVNAVLITRASDAGNEIEYANPAFERITGYQWKDVIGRDCKFLQGDDREQAGIDEIRVALREHREVKTLLRNYKRDGTLFWNQLYIAPVPDEQGVITHHISVVNDVTELVRSRDLLHKQANFDALTELPNRTLLGERLEEALVHAATFGSCVDIIFMDVDHFKDVNDSLGHNTGDRLLQEVAARLASSVDPLDTIARYGGDEFVIVVPGRPDEDRLSRVLSRLTAALEQPIWLDDTELQVETSMGLARFPIDGTDVKTLLKNADLALYKAKSNGRNRIHRFERGLAQTADARIALSRRMRRALKNDEFKLYYQPQINLLSNRVTGVEALLRWEDVELGPISPAIFIPIAEENGLIARIGEWVLNEACEQAKAWELSIPDIRMSINVSPRQFGSSDLHQLVQLALARCDLHPSMLELEITESALMAYGAVDVLHKLRNLGVSIAIDDFGTGYSSLAYLRNFRADRLKLDMSFVRGIGVNREDEAITRAVLALGHTLGFEVVAEGVETADQLGFLNVHGCVVIQGHYFAKPMAATMTESFIARYNHPAATSTKFSESTASAYLPEAS